MKGPKTSTALVVRTTFAISIAFGISFMWQMHSATLSSIGVSLSSSKDAFISESPHQTIEKHERKYHIGSSSSSSSEVIDHIDADADTAAASASASVQKLQQQLEEEKVKLELVHKTMLDFGDSAAEAIKKLKGKRSYERELKHTQNALEDVRDFLEKSQGKADISTKNLDSVVKQIAKLQAGGPDEAPTSLKVMMWDDSQTFHSPRETLLVNDGWFAYNGNGNGNGKDTLGDEKDDSSKAPWFVETDDPWEADLIVWISVMACHECEIPPTHPIMHAHKVIVLDFSDGCTIHQTRLDLMRSQTELAYFKRSFVYKLPDASFHSNCTTPDEKIIPYAYSGSKHLMIPLDVPEATLTFQPTLSTEQNAEVRDAKYIVHRPRGKGGVVYGAIPKAPDTEEYNNDDNGYFQDQRYENFLVPFRDRKWLVTTLIRLSDYNHEARNNVVQWMHEHSREKAGDPQTESEARVAGERGDGGGDGDGDGNSYTAYVGLVDGKCLGEGSGYCFGYNYLRHLRDAKIVVTCNPSGWEGDFRTWEAFLSGAMVMVDTMYILPWMPNPPIDGTHFVMYDPTKKEDFMAKLKYYSDPANADEVRTIAHAGYEFVLRHHMAVNRVDYILETVRSKLDEVVEDPAKRALFRLPSKQ